MKKVGIICEYNPLHNGHVYHFNQVKQESKADVVVLSLSSSFTERGDLSIINKFDKTRIALSMGVDLVIECPTLFSMQEAQAFAYYHVLNLVRASVDEIWIGSELNNPDIYELYYNLIESSEFQVKQKEFLNEGYSLKLSFSKALNHFKYTELLSNDQLGLFYYIALKKLNPNIKLKTIKRVSSNYNDISISESPIQSAQAIRKSIDSAKEFTPIFAHKYLDSCLDENILLPFVKSNIITCKNLSSLLEANEGIENRLKLILSSNSFDEALDTLQTKRYSTSKNKRLLMNVLLNLTKNDFKESKDDYNFIRVLGFNEKGKTLLNEIKDSTTIYTNVKDKINKCIDFELKVSKLLDTIYCLDLFKQEQKGPIIK